MICGGVLKAIQRRSFLGNDMTKKVPNIKEPNAPATNRQIFLIRRLTGKDVRAENLTRKQASDMIQAHLAVNAMEAKAKAIMAKKPSSTKKYLENVFQRILVEATKAADAAGDKWWDARCNKPYDPKFSSDHFGMFDLCGFAFINIRDRRSRFMKWYGKTYPEYARIGHIHIPYKYQPRQELGLRETCCRAALTVLQENGVTGLDLYSRVD